VRIHEKKELRDSLNPKFKRIPKRRKKQKKRGGGPLRLKGYFWIRKEVNNFFCMLSYPNSSFGSTPAMSQSQLMSF
jgi:hypothetical protein